MAQRNARVHLLCGSEGRGVLPVEPREFACHRPVTTDLLPHPRLQIHSRQFNCNKSKRCLNTSEETNHVSPRQQRYHVAARVTECTRTAPGSAPWAAGKDNHFFFMLCYLFLPTYCRSLPEIQRISNIDSYYLKMIFFSGFTLLVYVCLLHPLSQPGH